MTTPPSPDVDTGHRRVALVFVGLLLSVLLGALDQTIVATALPTIAGELGGVDSLSWVITGYLLATTATTPLWGKIGDLYGHKRVTVAALVVTLVGSTLCGLAWNLWSLIAFRAVQGIGAGGLMVMAMAVMGVLVPPRELGKYQGYIQAVFALASVVGPLVGGMLVDTFSWPWVFYINLPIGLVALMIIGVALPPVGNRFAREVDYLGSVLLVASVSALLLITTLGGRVYPWTSAPVLGLCVLFAVLLAAFLMWERRATEPVLPLPMLANPVVAVAAASALTVSACFFAANVFLPSYLQIVLGQNATRAGLRLLPMLLPIMLAAAGSGWLVTKTGRYKVYPVVGTALIALAMALFSLLDVDTDWWVLGLDMIVMGLGFGMIRQNLVIAVQNAVDRGQLGTATASTNFFSSLGGAIGLAAFGAIFTAQLGILLPRVPGSVAVDANSLVSSPQRIRQFDPATAAGVAHAVAGSLHVVFLAAFGVAVASVVIVLFLKELPLRGNAPGRGADGGRDAGRGRPAVDTTGTASSDRHEG